MSNYIYISGKITNNPNYIYDFCAAEEFILQNYPSFKVINPVAIGADVDRTINNPTYNDYMKRDVEHLLNCEAIFMIKGWESSLGAKAEHALAVAMNKTIYYQTGH